MNGFGLDSGLYPDPIANGDQGSNQFLSDFFRRQVISRRGSLVAAFGGLLFHPLFSSATSLIKLIISSIGALNGAKRRRSSQTRFVERKTLWPETVVREQILIAAVIKLKALLCPG